MVPIRGFTLPALLDRVEALLRWTVPGGASVPSCAYAADASGAMTRLDFPPPADDAARDALSAVLGLEMLERGATMCVLAQGRTAAADGAPGGDAAAECLVLEGIAFDGPVRREVRVYEVRRRLRRIEGFNRRAGEGPPPADGPRDVAAPR